MVGQHSSSRREPLVVVRGVDKVYEPSPWWLRILLRSAVDEPVVALRGVDLEVRSGEILAVVGPNGAGKSTLFRVLTGLTTPTHGTATVCGYDCTTESTEVRRRIGFMPAEDRTLFLRYSCEENLLFHGRMQGLPEKQIRPRIDEVLEITNLTAARTRAGFALSSGMRARLQLARALLPKPPVLILDEPTGPVDPVSAHSFLETLQTITAEEGTAVLLSSHRLEEIDALSESVALLSEGRIIFRGDLEHLRAISERPRFEIDFVDEGAADAASAILAEEFARDPEAIVDRRGSTLVISVDRPPGQILRGLGDHVDDVTSIVEGRMPLRDLFVHVLSTNSRTSEPSR